jgi:hypothetical protein
MIKKRIIKTFEAFSHKISTEWIDEMERILLVNKEGIQKFSNTIEILNHLFEEERINFRMILEEEIKNYIESYKEKEEKEEILKRIKNLTIISSFLNLENRETTFILGKKFYEIKDDEVWFNFIQRFKFLLSHEITHTEEHDSLFRKYKENQEDYLNDIENEGGRNLTRKEYLSSMTEIKAYANQFIYTLKYLLKWDKEKIKKFLMIPKEYVDENEEITKIFDPTWNRYLEEFYGTETWEWFLAVCYENLDDRQNIL